MGRLVPPLPNVRPSFAYGAPPLRLSGSLPLAPLAHASRLGRCSARKLASAPPTRGTLGLSFASRLRAQARSACELHGDPSPWRARPVAFLAVAQKLLERQHAASRRRTHSGRSPQGCNPSLGTSVALNPCGVRAPASGCPLRSDPRFARSITPPSSFAMPCGLLRSLRSLRSPPSPNPSFPLHPRNFSTHPTHVPP